MKKYCWKCEKEVNATLKTIEETYTIRDKEYTLNTAVYLCPHCKTDLFDEKADNATLEKLKEMVNK